MMRSRRIFEDPGWGSHLLVAEAEGFGCGREATTSWAPMDSNKEKGSGGVSFVIPRGQGMLPTEGSGGFDCKP